MIEHLKKNPFTDEIFISPPVAPKYSVPSLPSNPSPPPPEDSRHTAVTHSIPQPPSPGSPRAAIHLVSTTILTACVPACLDCLSCWYVERAWSDGTEDLACYVCKRPVTGEAYPNAADDRRAAKAAQREAEDAAIEVKG
jgi:hypothetical protein